MCSLASTGPSPPNLSSPIWPTQPTVDVSVKICTVKGAGCMGNPVAMLPSLSHQQRADLTAGFIGFQVSNESLHRHQWLATWSVWPEIQGAVCCHLALALQCPNQRKPAPDFPLIVGQEFLDKCPYKHYHACQVPSTKFLFVEVQPYEEEPTALACCTTLVLSSPCSLPLPVYLSGLANCPDT
jgi:hypothetical protein